MKPLLQGPVLQAGLDSLDQGVSIFDGDLRLVAWNRRFVELLRLPQALVRDGASFADLARHLASGSELGRGEAAEAIVERRVQAARRCVRSYTESTSAEGRIIAAQTNPLPGGGFVTVYTDITERSLAETFTRERSGELEARVNQRTLELRTVNEELRRSIGRLEDASAAREKAERALHEAQKISAIGQLAGGLAHDFNNLLTVIVGGLSSLRERIDPALVRELVEPAVRASERGAAITRRLLAFARQQALEPSAVDVGALIAGTAQLLRRSLPGNIVIECAPPPEQCLALTDPGELENAIVNLALNARDAMPAGGTLSFTVASHEGDSVRIDVRDSGTGIAPDIQARIFEPFFTTKPFGSGSGLGLSMVFGFVRQSGGDIRVESAPGQGTCVTLVLPRAHGKAAPIEVPADEGQPASANGELVLLVEDHDDVRREVRRQLLELGYRVLEARDGEDARALLESVPDVSFLLSDIVMPGALDGLALADHARHRNPGLRVLLISGFAELAPAGYDWFDSRQVLRKPFNKEDLARALQRQGTPWTRPPPAS